VSRVSDAEKKSTHKKRTAWLDDHQIRNPGMRQFLVAYERVGTISGACRELGFGVLKIQNWQHGFTTCEGRKNNPTPEGEHFKQAMEEARVRHVERLEIELERRAMKGSDNLLMFLLRGADPGKYRESGRGGSATPGLPATVNVQINQLTQAAMQDPDKLAKVLELAKQHGLLDRLMSNGDSVVEGPTTNVEVKNEQDQHPV
jgi:hypothetical protein